MTQAEIHAAADTGTETDTHVLAHPLKPAPLPANLRPHTTTPRPPDDADGGSRRMRRDARVSRTVLKQTVGMVASPSLSHPYLSLIYHIPYTYLCR